MPINLVHNADLQPHNTLAIPAIAKVLAEVTSIDELKEAVVYAHDQKLRILILGEGSNTVFAGHFNGLVILNRLMGIEVLESKTESVTVKVSAGENWHKLVEYSVDRQWYGLENLALIPGLVGAAPIQNIGAYGAEVKDSIVQVDVLDIATGLSKVLANNECQFAYRDSIFKHRLADQVIISAVTFRLSRGQRSNCNIAYPALSSRFSQPPTPKQVFDAVCEIRSSKLPAPQQIPNAGSFFKNPIVSAEHHSVLAKVHPGLVSFSVRDGYKLAAGWLIEQAGWKNIDYDGVSVHQEQALVLINPQRRSARQVLKFAHAIQKDIEAKFSVTLEIEPRVV